jgi:hypothetical protein
MNTIVVLFLLKMAVNHGAGYSGDELRGAFMR